MFVDPRGDREDADQPVDDRGHAGEQPDDGLERAPHRRRRELGEEDAASVETTSAISNGQDGGESVPQISGQARK